MNINSSYISNLSGQALAKAPDPVQATQTRALAQAVAKLNGSPLIPENRELSMAIDPKTKISVVRVLDADTHEVLDQFPAEYVLRVTAFLESQEAQDSLSKIPSLNR
jgi:uncharacterized FlaG/YvyC family protein